MPEPDRGKFESFLGNTQVVDIAIMPEGSALNPSMIVSATTSAERRSLKFNLLTFD